VGPQEDRVALDRLASALGVGRAVEFVGWVPDIYDLIAAGEVFVQSSIDESLSQTITEARGLGVPVATTSVGGIAEVMGEDVEPIAAGDDGHLARRIGSLLADPDAAHAEAAAAVSGTRERFSAATMTAAYVSLYAQLAGTRSDA
jgi:glycosyltransferase involved in cell wall biosynthesis